MYRLHDKIDRMFSSPEGKLLYSNAISLMQRYGMQEIINKGVLVGFSGGPDSVMLLSLLIYHRQKCGDDYPVVASHINHMIRGESADRDARFALDFSAALNIECSVIRIDVPALAIELGIGIEEAARNARYSEFDRILSGRDDISCIMLAHNSTDNLETVMLNMLRGSGVLGMSGIPPVRDNIIRPLLSCSKKDILSLLDLFEIPYVIDETNSQTDYSRNYIRNRISPLFERLNPNPDAALFRMSENLRMAFDYIEISAMNVISEIDDPMNFSSSIISSLHPAVLSRVFSILCEKACGAIPEEKHIKYICDNICNESLSISVPGGYDFIKQRGICSLRRIDRTASSVLVKLEHGINKIDGYALTAFVGEELDKSLINVYKKSIKVRIPSAIIEDGLYLRFRKEGDSYRYGGMTHRLKKVFNDRNIPPFMRDSIPIIVDCEGIIWVPGLPLNDRIDVSCDAITLTLCFGGDEGALTAYTAHKM